MDWSSVIGICLGVVVLTFGIILSGVGILPYLSLGSLLITVLGSYGAVMISNPLNRALSIFRYTRIIFMEIDWNTPNVISVLVNLADRARREGLLALEDTIESLNDPFIRQGIQLVVDGTDPDIIRSILFSDLGKMQDRHGNVIQLFDEWGRIAPAFGLIGTIIGLISMLGNIGGDISVIGRGLQTALVTTLYGAIMANIILIPIRNKLENHDNNETLSREIIIEGILSIQSGDNPRILFEKLLVYLPDVDRVAVRRSMNSEWSYGH